MARRARSKSRGRSTTGRSRSHSNRTPRQLDTPDSSLRTASEKRSSAYDANFQQALIDVGIYPQNHQGFRDRRPRNRDAIIARLERRRESISGLDEDAFDNFVQKDHDARSEKTVMSTVFPIIRGSADIPFGEEKLFGNLVPLAEHPFTGRVPDTPPSAFVSWCNG
ncbi:hypothetical protein ASPCAL13778 [Aspergillus calidoustus]|uniref:Uncharacterized protein n=1 Tax=Aspergillus calidoustus TaxID=454130 RepID=A0A0U5GFK5_ASPCI|nr:hypothetical protein ASPCAL13778 [Aspergillus calidoustus]